MCMYKDHRWAMCADNIICFLMGCFGRGAFTFISLMYICTIEMQHSRRCSNVIEPTPGGGSKFREGERERSEEREATYGL